RGLEKGSLLKFLLSGAIDFVELRGGLVLADDAQRLLQELGGLQAIAAGKALGLHGRLPLGTDNHFDDARHQRVSTRRALDEEAGDELGECWRRWRRMASCRNEGASLSGK